jgi:hypothetical protein
VSLHPALLEVIEALAKDEARRDYLAAQAAREAASSDERTKPVPLPATERAA